MNFVRELHREFYRDAPDAMLRDKGQAAVISHEAG